VTPGADADPDADVCVVGSGPAGAILAASLATRGHDVVVLEAGPRFDFEDRPERMERALRPTSERADVWEMGGDRDAYSTSGAVDYRLNDARVKGVGGTSLHWGAMTPRFHPEDFEMQSRHGVAEDWPISYADLEPYYVRAEREMGVAGEASRFGGPRSAPYPLPAHPFSHADELFAEAFEAVGAELHHCPRAINSEPNDGRSQCVGFGTCTPVCPSGAKYTADVHVREAEAAGARVIAEAPVQRLEHDGAGDRVVAAVYAKGGTERRLRARTFVLAAGGVESPRLLLNSASDRYPDGLANSSGLVGRRFVDHPGITVAGRLDEPTRQHLIGFGTSITEQFYDHDSGPEGSVIIGPDNNAGQAPATTALSTRPVAGRLADGDLLAPFEGDRWGEAVLERVRAESTGQVRLSAWAEPLPDPDNRVALDRSTTDDHGNPVPDVSFAVGDHARGTLERVEPILHRILDALGADAVETVVGPDDPWFGHHHVGTTRMGTDPGSSVVRPDLRTHDLANLYVSSSGVFVTAGAANPTLTIAALTLRLADRLHDRLS
jgi:choline dehydrogenase-like flavoprotein